MARRRVLVTIAASAAAVAGLSVPPAQEAAVAAVGIDASHPYSDPVWFPLRNWSQNDCYNTNCRNADGSYEHGAWIMDIDAARQTNGAWDPRGEYPTDDPVHPMGAGIAHIGSGDERCGPVHGGGRGAWVWIDHGNGVTSQYGHLLDLRVTEGQHVTPTTQLAVVGNSGYLKCETNPEFRYLYLAVKHDSQYVEVPTMAACRADTGARVTWPGDEYPDPSSYVDGATEKTWNTLKVPETADFRHPFPHQPLPPTSDTCMPASIDTPARPASAPSASRPASGRLSFSWVKGVGVTSTAVELQRKVCDASGSCKWIPQAKQVTPLASATFAGLENGRHYRARLWAHNGIGYSSPSSWKEAWPAWKPGTPGQKSESRYPTSLTLAWVRSNPNGTPLTHYEVAIRRRTSTGSWTAFSYRDIAADRTWWSFTGLRRATTYQLAVRAINAMGDGGWLVRTVSTTR